MIARFLCLICLLAACGQGETPVQENDPEAGEETQVEQAAEPQPLSLMARCAEVRGFEESPPDSGLAGSFFVRGELLFHLQGGAEKGGKSIEQDAEMWLGGAAQLRFSLSKNGRTNLFLLADAKQSWVSVNSGEFRENPPEVLAEECRIRWEVLRFPWGWENTLANAQANEDGLYFLERSFGETLFRLELNQDLLPHRASFGKANCTLSDWRSAPVSTSVYPHHWLWPNGEDSREERLTSVGEQAFFLDSAFLPPKPEDAVLTQGNETGSELSGGGMGDLSLVEGTLAYLTEDDASTFGEDPPRGAWWRIGEERFFLQAEQRLLLADAPDGTSFPTRQQSATSWLRWTTTAAISDEDALQRLEAVAKQQKLEADGPLWALITDRANAPRVFLLPLRAESP